MPIPTAIDTLSRSLTVSRNPSTAVPRGVACRFVRQRVVLFWKETAQAVSQTFLGAVLCPISDTKLP